MNKMFIVTPRRSLDPLSMQQPWRNVAAFYEKTYNMTTITYDESTSTFTVNGKSVYFDTEGRLTTNQELLPSEERAVLNYFNAKNSEKNEK